jgi:hypothetical protein
MITDASHNPIGGLTRITAARSHSISAENRTGEKCKGGMATLEAVFSRLADDCSIDGSSLEAVIRRWLAFTQPARVVLGAGADGVLRCKQSLSDKFVFSRLSVAHSAVGFATPVVDEDRRQRALTCI